jgi:hypothetical protein
MRRLAGKLSLGALGAMVVTAGTLAATATLPACNKHVFEIVPRDCTAELQKKQQLDIEVPADILIVIDNSGSMCEEQANLVENFFDPNCPIDVNDVQRQYQNPDDETLAQLASQCGFVQLLAAYDNDWRIGVITTDVGQCDNRYGLADLGGFSCSGDPVANWGRRPQRGCLQPTHALGNPTVPRVLKRGDANVAEKFTDILANIQTFGSAFERGLDAVEVFLSPDSDRAPGCENDLDTFLRDDAKLVVIFVTDEDDCSHADGAPGLLLDENEGDSCENEKDQFPQFKNPPRNPNDCYTERDKLAPVSRYAEFLRKVKGDVSKVSVAVIAGATKDGGDLKFEGCSADPQTGQPVGGCYESWGSSNDVRAPLEAGQRGGKCHPDTLALDGITEPCCEADPGTRYFQLAQQFGGESLLDSICFDSFRGTMLRIAQFIAAIDRVTLTERPASPAAILVQILRAGETERESIERIPDNAETAGRSGWKYDGDKTVVFFGDALPRPGDEIFIAALAEREDPDNLCDSAGTPSPADAGSAN